jgi:hypothetical protein
VVARGGVMAGFACSLPLPFQMVRRSRLHGVVHPAGGLEPLPLFMLKMYFSEGSIRVS